MDQAIRDLETRHENILARALRILDSRYKSLRSAVAIFGIILTIGVAAGIHAVSHEAAVRTSQFCRLIVTRHNDLIDRYNGSVMYLKTPAGHEKTGLNVAIKAIIPQQRQQITVERKSIPSVCTEEYPLKQVQN